MALDLFNVARASGQRAAVADIVASLRASQDRIAEALRAYDDDLNATSHGGRRSPLAGGAAVTELPLPAAVPIHVLRFTSPAVEALAAADARTHTDSLPHAQFKDFGPSFA